MKQQKQRWWTGANKKTIKFINELVDEFPFRMFEVKDRILYMLIDHYKYSDYKTNAKRVRLCKDKVNGVNGYYYVNTPI